MKGLILLLFLIILFSCNSLSQVPYIEWQKSYGGNGNDGAFSVKQTFDRGFIVAGYSSSNNGNVTGNHGSNDFWVVKLGVYGNIEWQKSFGGTGDDKASSVVQCADSSYIIAGKSNSNNGDATNNHGGYDVWVVKLNSAGIMQWQKSFGGTLDDYATSLQQTNDGGYIMACSTNSFSGDITHNHGNSYDYWVVKLNSSGNIAWQRCYGGSIDDFATSIIQKTQGGYIVTGLCESGDSDVTMHHGYIDYWVISLSDSGTIEWQKSYGGLDFDEPFSIKQTFDGGFIIAGGSASVDQDVKCNTTTTPQVWIVKISDLGAIQWQKCFGGSGDDQATAIQQTADSGYIITGYSNSNNGDVTGHHDNYDYWVLRLNSGGSLQWQKSLGGSGIDFPESIVQTTDGGFMVAGYSNSNDFDITSNHGGYDFWLVKLSAGGVGINNEQKEARASIYPNPARNEITIVVTSSLVGEQYRISDQIGKIVLKGTLTKEKTSVSINELANGIYFLKIGENNIQTFKIIKY